MVDKLYQLWKGSDNDQFSNTTAFRQTGNQIFLFKHDQIEETSEELEESSSSEPDESIVDFLAVYERIQSLPIPIKCFESSIVSDVLNHEIKIKLLNANPER